jgi:hypothetical protein
MATNVTEVIHMTFVAADLRFGMGRDQIKYGHNSRNQTRRDI